METKPLQVIHSNAYHIFIPEKVYQPFVDKKMSRVQVKVSHLNKAIEFYAAVKRDKASGDFKMMFSKAKQKELNLEIGDEFTLQLFEDTSKYGVDMPEELEAVLLSDYDAYQIFESLTKGKQRSIIYGITRFKGSQNKIDKSLIMCENLKRRKLDPYTIFKL